VTLSAAILNPMLRADPVGPRITYYDDATGERIELSAVTLANWAAKTGNLLRDELGGGPASRVAVLLPAHWQTAAALFGVWWIGADVLLDGADATGASEVAVLSMDAFGRPVPDLPIGVTDYATAVRVHGDQIVAEQHPGPALAGRSVEQVLDACQKSAAAKALTADDRVLSTASWSTADDVIDGLLSVLAVGGSLVYVANPDPAGLPRRTETEKVTRSG
jgi:uncharacterized protein (TIGR03089 family)